MLNRGHPLHIEQHDKSGNHRSEESLSSFILRGLTGRKLFLALLTQDSHTKPESDIMNLYPPTGGVGSDVAFTVPMLPENDLRPGYHFFHTHPLF